MCGGEMETPVRGQAQPGQDGRFAAAAGNQSIPEGKARAKTAAQYYQMKREAAVMALTDLDPQDAAQICAAVLEEAAAGMPGFDPWGDIRADAAFWADFAHPAELEIYAAVAMQKLGQRALGKQMRKRVFKDLWRSFTKTERTAFLRHVQGRAA